MYFILKYFTKLLSKNKIVTQTYSSLINNERVAADFQPAILFYIVLKVKT